MMSSPSSPQPEPDRPEPDSSESDASVGLAGGSDEDLESIFRELIERSAPIEDLDADQRRAWVSGLMAAWRSDINVEDPDDTDRAFVEFVRSHGAAVANETVAELLETTAVELLDPRGDDVVVSQSWMVTDRRSRDEVTVVITFRRGDDHHSILASVLDGALVDLQVSGDVDELFGRDHEELAANSTLEVSTIEAGAAIAVLEQGWAVAAQSLSNSEIAESLLANQLMARADLVAQGVSAESLPLLRSHPATAPAVFFDGCSPAEIADGNRWALDALTTALRPHAQRLGADAAADPAWHDPNRYGQIAVPLVGPLDGLSRREQDALVYLEWADWVGAIVAMVGADRSTPLDGETIVDLINAQPELTTAIEANDRAYVAYGFDVALAVWADAGLIMGGIVVPGALSAIVDTAKLAWSPGAGQPTLASH